MEKTLGKTDIENDLEILVDRKLSCSNQRQAAAAKASKEHGSITLWYTSQTSSGIFATVLATTVQDRQLNGFKGAQPQ